jgi:DNA-binding CsgD family transcriptional regulator
VSATPADVDSRRVSLFRHSLTAADLQRLLAAEREALPFLAFSDESGTLRLHPLDGAQSATLGRGDHNAVALPWDAEVSRTHAQLELVGDAWTVSDDGLSRNGSFVNGARTRGRCRLSDGDTLRVGRTSLLFRWPGRTFETTLAARSGGEPPTLSEAQGRVLTALAQPFASTGVPATNREIAEALHLSIDGVKTHIRTLFDKLAVADLPQYAKRAELARRAVELGLVRAR